MRIDLWIVGAVSFASGILIRSFSVGDMLWSSVVCVGVMCGAVMVWLRGLVPKMVMVSICVASILCMVGIVRMGVVADAYNRIEQELAFATGREVEVEGVIVRDPERRDTRQILVVRADRIDGQPVDDPLVRIGAERTADTFLFGDRVRAQGLLEVPDSFETDLGRMFPYGGYVRAQDITHTLSFSEVVRMERATRLSPAEQLFYYLYAFKHGLIRGIEAMLPEPYAGLGEGLLLGEKRALGSDLEDVFRAVGVIHIVVLSGYNLSIVAESVMRLLARFLSVRARVVVGGVMVLLFACAVGLSATVVRASIMALVVLWARAVYRTYDAMRALACAAVVMMFWNPYVLLYDPGFHLSFLATLGLLLVAPILEPYMARVPTRWQVREYVGATIATTIVVAPYLLYAMGELSIIAVCANVLIVMMVPWAMGATLLAGVVGMIVPDTLLIVGYPAYVALAYMVHSAEYLAQIPFARITVPTFSLWYIVGAYTCMAAAVLYMYRVQTRIHRDPHGSHGVSPMPDRPLRQL